jgi:hypothetical protein
VIDPTGPASTLDQAVRWRASSAVLGRPGAPDQGCADGLDNDGDALVDFPADPGCPSAGEDGENPACDDGLDNDGDTLVDGADPQCASPAGTSEAPGPVDHYLCYQTRPSQGSPSFTPQVVPLDDAFDGARGFSVIRPKALCLPADAGSAPVDAATHLESYQIREAVGEPRHVRRTALFITSQLGPIFVDTRVPDRLLLPTAKDLASPVPPLDFASHDVDHYKCYTVVRSPGRPKYFPTGVVARISDQFEDRAYGIRGPSRLCLPVVVNGQAIKDPNRRLLCYGARRDRTAPFHTPRFRVNVHSALGAEQVDSVREEELCVPAS